MFAEPSSASVRADLDQPVTGALSKNTGSILVFRFLSGCFAAAPLTNSGYDFYSLIRTPPDLGFELRARTRFSRLSQLVAHLAVFLVDWLETFGKARFAERRWSCSPWRLSQARHWDQWLRAG